jgi:hypothetical protein
MIQPVRSTLINPVSRIHRVVFLYPVRSALINPVSGVHCLALTYPVIKEEFALNSIPFLALIYIYYFL